MTEILESHVPCSDCGSSDAKTIYVDHEFCFSCEKYTPKGPPQGRFTYEFLSWRGIDKGTMSFYGVKTKVAENGEPIALGYRYHNGATKIRMLDKKAFYTEKSHLGDDISKAGLFGKDKFAAGGHKTITITEGEADALSLYQVIRSPVVSVQSSSSALRDCSLDYDEKVSNHCL